jgi:hypothetical protein
MPVFATALRSSFRGWSSASAAVAGVATLGVAATPLDVSPTVDMAHGGFATVAYVAMALTPALAAGHLKTTGRIAAARVSQAASLVSATCLAATVAGPAHGFFQRAGLTVVDAWMIAVAASLMRSARSG